MFSLFNNRWGWNNQINYNDAGRFPNYGIPNRISYHQYVPSTNRIPYYNGIPNRFSNPYYAPPMNFGPAFGGPGGIPPYQAGAPFGQQSFYSGNAGASASAGASAGTSIGPNGGFQHAQISPVRLF